MSYTVFGFTFNYEGIRMLLEMIGIGMHPCFHIYMIYIDLYINESKSSQLSHDLEYFLSNLTKP